MQRWNKKIVITIGFIFCVMLVNGCTQQVHEVTEPLGEESKAAEDVAIVVEETEKPAPNEEPILKEERAIAESVVPKKEEFKIFNPVLTYDGAYNGPLYGTSEQIGSASMDSYFKTLDRNGINFFIGMFSIEGKPAVGTLTSDSGLGKIVDAVQKHPYRIIPFFNPGIGGETVEQYLGEQLTGMYRNSLTTSQKIVGKNFIRGFGEVETQEWQARHNDQRILDLIEMAQANDIHFMFHPVAAKMDDVTKIIEAYPDTTFLIHMYREDLDKSRDKLITMLKEHDNLYFSMDAAHILFVNGNDIIYTYDGKDKETSISAFVSTFDSKEKSIIAGAISAYKPLVDAVPDKIMWGTEIGPEYAFDSQVFDRAVKISRFVIAGFDKEHQEAVGYKNALRVFGEGVKIDQTIVVKDTSAWTECTSTQMSDCDESCNIPDEDFLTSEQEACYSSCLARKNCSDAPVMDEG